MTGVRIYGCHIGQEVPEVVDHEWLNILVIHAPISDDHPYAKYNAEEFLKEHSDYDLILCGDIHKKFVIEKEGRIICNTGPMIRKTVKEWEHAPCYFEYDTTDRTLIECEIPHEPAEDVLSHEHIEAEEKRQEMLGEFVTKVKSKKMESTKIEKNIQTFCEQNEISTKTQDILAEVMND
jgi:DNA repair exonuclease SbcCD nuclease subunit